MHESEKGAFEKEEGNRNSTAVSLVVSGDTYHGKISFYYIILSYALRSDFIILSSPVLVVLQYKERSYNIVTFWFVKETNWSKG